MTRRAVAYIRRSARGEAQASEELQRDTVQRLAAARGDTLAHVYRDWGHSGGSEARPQYRAMLEAIEDGTVAVVYAYDQDRLARSNWLFAGLLDLADRHDLAIVTPAGDLADPDRRDGAEYRGVGDGIELRKITKRNRANHERRLARGDDLGEAPYGWTKVKLTEDGLNAHGRPAKAGAVVNVQTDPQAITTVLNAYAAAGSALGAARLLNAAGHPTKRGKTWNNRAVADVVSREAPELMPARLGRTNARHYRVRLLSGILRCYCGTVMSPNGQGWTCAQGARGAHGRPYNVAEARLLPWIREEADRLAIPGDELAEPGAAYDDGPERQALEALRGKVSDAVVDAGLAELAAKRAEHGERIVMLRAIPPRIDFEGWTVEAVNAALRALWDHVQLGPDLLPLPWPEGFEWTVPEWRQP